MESTMRPSSADDVLDLMDVSFHSAALGAALELGLFWLLDDQPLDAEQVAQELAIPLKRCRYWLQLLGQIGLIEEDPGGYQLSSTARVGILEAYSRETLGASRRGGERSAAAVFATFQPVFASPVRRGKL